MSDAKCCDRCGKFYIPSLEASKARKSYQGIRVDFVRLCGGNPTGHMYELCTECANELVAFMSIDDYMNKKLPKRLPGSDPVEDNTQEMAKDTYDNFGVGENNEERNDTNGEEGET